MKFLCKSSGNDTNDSFVKSISSDDDLFLRYNHLHRLFICGILYFFAFSVELIKIFQKMQLLGSCMQQDIQAVIWRHHPSSRIESRRDLKSDVKRIDRSFDIQIIQEPFYRFGYPSSSVQ